MEDVRIYPDHTIRLMTSRRRDIEDLDAAVEQEKMKALIKEMRAYASGFEWSETAEYFIRQVDSVGMAACIMSPVLQISNEERYAILAEDSLAARAELIEKTLYEYMEVARITNEANSSQQEEYQQRYKEAAIKRQMEHLQKELDDMHPENVTDVQKFQQRIAESGMNETARKEAEKVLNRLRQEGKESVESGMLYDYLDFVTTLSWKKAEAERIDLEQARKILDEDHYGLKKVKDRIIQQIAVMNLKQQQSGSILLFVGAPGTGKTSIGKSIARALGRQYVRVSLGGVHDESDIRGHRRTYIGSMPGRIMDGIHKSGVSNPVMVLDEVDKLSASFNGSPASALLEVLDPEQNNTFTDHYMNVPYDLSDVEAWLGAVISLVIIKSGIEMLRDTISQILGEKNDPELARSIKKTVVSFPEVQGAYDLVLNNYGPDTWNGSIHIEVPDTYSADRLDQLIRDIQTAVYKQHQVILTAIGVYSMNTRDEEVIETQKKVREIVFSHQYVKQMHGFYLIKDQKAMRFDIVVSFDAEDRKAVYEDVLADVQKAFPDYTLQVAMDTDFAEE